MDYKTGIEEIDKELDERFAILSPTVRQLLSGDAVPQIADTLRRRYGLDEDMQSGIENEIALVLMYVEPVDDFAATLMSEYLIAPEVAFEIEKEVTAQLFTTIMNELGKSSELNDGVSRADADKPLPIIPVTDIPIATPTSTTPITGATVPATPLVASTTIPAMRVMPKSETELTGSLLHSLRSTLAHDASKLEPYVEQPTPKAAYNSILETKPQAPTTPLPPNHPQS